MGVSEQEELWLKLPTFSSGDSNTSRIVILNISGTKTEDPGPGKKSGNADTSPFTLGEGLPPVPAKLVSKIRQVEYVDVAKLLQDSMELEHDETPVTHPPIP